MNKTIINTTFKISAIFIALSFTALNANAVEFGNAESVDVNATTKAFKLLDTDNDGTLTYSEARKDKVFAKGISKADLDHDKTLDEQEYADYKSKAQKKETKRVISDSTITTKTKAKILKAEGFKGMQISVETHAGVVQLSGFVDNEAQIKTAEEIAAGVEGVKSVKNSLLVKKG